MELVARAGGQRRVERTEVGSEDLRAAQDRVEITAHDVLAAGPFAAAGRCPRRIVFSLVEKHDAIRHALQNLLVLQQLADLDRFLKPVRPEINACKRLLPEQIHRADGIFDLHNLVGIRRRPKKFAEVCSAVANQQDFRFARQDFQAPYRPGSR